MEMIQILDQEIQIKEWAGQRVITFQDIDMVHQRARGTASRNFRENRDKFIEGTDFFKICADEIRRRNLMEISTMARDNITVLTESGYLMIVKSLHDDLAWAVQRELVNTYFKAKEQAAAPVEETTVAVVNHETLLRAASIMATCPNSTQYVVNILRELIPTIDKMPTVTLQVDEMPVEIPKLPAPETAVVKTTKTRKSPEFPFFNRQKFKKDFAEGGWTAIRLAREIGCEADTVRNWLNCKAVPRYANRDKLCAVMGHREGFYDR